MDTDTHLSFNSEENSLPDITAFPFLVCNFNFFKRSVSSRLTSNSESSSSFQAGGGVVIFMCGCW